MNKEDLKTFTEVASAVSILANDPKHREYCGLAGINLAKHLAVMTTHRANSITYLMARADLQSQGRLLKAKLKQEVYRPAGGKLVNSIDGWQWAETVIDAME